MTIMTNLLISWIGKTDLMATQEIKDIGLGPIAQAVKTKKYYELHLLTDEDPEITDHYVEWLKSKFSIDIKVYPAKLSSPTSFEDIYKAAFSTLTNIKKKYRSNNQLTFHISPGTPQMCAIWVLLSKTHFPAEIIESSKEYGVKTARIPFDISVDFIPDLLRSADKKLERLTTGSPVEAPEFSDIIQRSRSMQLAIAKAKRIAPRSIPVLIEGESGTGKELFARAIHESSLRKDQSFIVINCGAIPENLIESELFGHEKGSFSGAIKSKMGYFEAAHQGTIFLDEIGELPIEMQVKLLRTIQEGEIIRIGATEPRRINFRVIAATNRNLLEEVSKGSFREDLFYRIAVGVIKLPPLRDREGDISLLIDHFINKINKESIRESGYVHKKISASAKNIMLQHLWPGNVRELQNTLTRAVVWSANETIIKDEIRDALFSYPDVHKNENKILNRQLDYGIDLPDLLKKVASHYIERGLIKYNGNKTKTAKILGISNYQTLTNWMKRYKIEP
jgi:transcriptional regulator with PAS, ATPase and Fis domain